MPIIVRIVIVVLNLITKYPSTDLLFVGGIFSYCSTTYLWDPFLSAKKQ